MDDFHSPLINLALLESLKSTKQIDEIDLYIPFIAVSISKIEAETFSSGELKKNCSKYIFC